MIEKVEPKEHKIKKSNLTEAFENTNTKTRGGK
jgi:hypothetical protein